MTQTKLIIPLEYFKFDANFNNRNFDKRTGEVKLELYKARIKYVGNHSLSMSINLDYLGDNSCDTKTYYYNYVLEVDCKNLFIPEDFNSNEQFNRLNQEASLIFNKSLVIFKLFRDQTISSQWFIVKCKKETIALGKRHYRPWGLPNKHFPDYFLLSEDELDFKNHWKEYFNINPQVFAVNRFNYATYQPYDYFRFLDWAQSFESLFSSHGFRNDRSLSAEFCILGAQIIKNEMGAKNNIDNIRKILLYMWKLRCAIVHGDDSTKTILFHDENLLGKIIKRMHLYARESIKFFYTNQNMLENPNDRNDFLDNYLDNNMGMQDNDLNAEYDTLAQEFASDYPNNLSHWHNLF